MPITHALAQVTRRLQALSPQRPLQGLYRISQHLPHYQGQSQLPSGVHMTLDTRIDAQRSIFWSGVYQAALTHLLRQHINVGDYCLDIGANYGFYALDFAQQVGETGKVAAFEANPTLLSYICDNAQINKFSHLTAFGNAVYSVSGDSIPFYISRQEGKSSLLENLVQELEQQITIDTITVDDFMQKENWDRLDLIKIDIEGSDIEAIIGAQATIHRFRPLIAFEYKNDLPSERVEIVQELFKETDYQLQMLTTHGERSAFEWTVPSGYNNVDVLCLPH